MFSWLLIFSSQSNDPFHPSQAFPCGGKCNLRITTANYHRLVFCQPGGVFCVGGNELNTRTVILSIRTCYLLSRRWRKHTLLITLYKFLKPSSLDDCRYLNQPVEPATWLRQKIHILTLTTVKDISANWLLKYCVQHQFLACSATQVPYCKLEVKQVGMILCGKRAHCIPLQNNVYTRFTTFTFLSSNVLNLLNPLLLEQYRKLWLLGACAYNPRQ